MGARKRVATDAELTHLASFPEENPNAVVEVDAVGGIIYMNPAAQTAFPDLRRMGSRHPLLEKMPAVIRGLRLLGKHSIAREVQVGERWYDQKISLNDRIQLYMTDLTERKQVERLKNEFISTVSHELRTPLTTIREGVSQVLDGILGETTEKQRRFLSVVLEDVNRLGRIVNDLLSMSRLEAGRMELRRARVDLVGLARGLSRMAETQAKPKGVSVRVSCSQERVEASVDRDRIAQVLTNLLDNALKVTTQGHIEIALVENGRSVECAVSDTGCGIAESDLPRIFDKFEQCGRRAGPGHQGTGLGLAICKGLVELHGGTISVESQVGEGSTFTFILPKNAIRDISKGQAGRGWRRRSTRRGPRGDLHRHAGRRGARGAPPVRRGDRSLCQRGN